MPLGHKKNNKLIKKLNVNIETETEKDIVIIFAEPSTKDLEDLLGESYVLNLVSGIIWDKKQIGGTDWMQIWEKKRSKWEASQNVGGCIFQDVFVPGKVEAKDIKEDIDLFLEEDSVIVEDFIDHAKNLVVQTGSNNIDSNMIDENSDDFDTAAPAVCDAESRSLANRSILHEEETSFDLINSLNTKEIEDKNNLLEILIDIDDISSEVVMEKNSSLNHKSCDICNKIFLDIHNLILHNKEVHNGIKPFLCDRCKKRFIIKDDLAFHQKVHCKEEEMIVCEECNVLIVKSSLIKHYKEVHNGKKPYSCDRCEKGFIIKDDLALHKQIHCKVEPKKQELITCDVCNAPFLKRFGLIKHNNDVHNGIKPFSCDICEQRFIKRDDLAFHKKDYCKGEKPEKIICDECNESFLGRRNFIQHKKESHPDTKPYSCDRCDKRFIIKDDLAFHKQMQCKVHPIICEICNESFIGRRNFDHHNKEAHNDIRPFVCDKCKKRFILKDDLAFHKKMPCKAEKQETIICDECNEPFLGRSNFIQHKKEAHKGIKSFSCNICEKNLSSTTSLKDHKLVHTGSKPHTCDICGKSFSLSKNLKTHRRIHTGEKPFPCKQCGKSFASGSALSSHKRTHFSKKTVICDICSKALTSLISLERHKKYFHTDAGEKPLSCSNCDKKFIFPHKLTIHMRVHTGEKPFSCDICGKSYAAKSILVRHQAAHSDENHHYCDICQKSFRFKVNFTRHNKSAGHLNKIKERLTEAC